MNAPMTNENDLIRRGDALAAIEDAYDDGLEPDLYDATTRVAALPAVTPAVILAAALELPEVKALVEAVDAEINARQAYEALLEWGGNYEKRVKAKAAWHLAIAEMMRALAAVKPDAKGVRD